MLFRRTLAVALLCALPVAAFADDAATKIKWPMPWKLGTTVKYASEDLTQDQTKAQPQRTRSTSTATVRIDEARADGFLQTWRWDDGTYEVLEGDKGEAAQMRAIAREFDDLPLEVGLTLDGNFANVRNMGVIAPRMQKALRPVLIDTLDKQIAKTGAKPDEAKRSAAVAAMDAALAAMTEPKVLEAMLSRNIAWFNSFVGLEVEPDQTWELDVQLPNPLGGEALPGKLRFQASVSKDDPDDLYVDYEQAPDAEKTKVLVGRMIEKMSGKKLTDAELATMVLDVKDTGLFVVHRPTGIVEMFEATRTTTIDGKQKVERHRLRQLDGAHDHVWRDEAGNDDDQDA